MRTSQVIFIAHRGESHDAPENTLPAINLAWQRDVDAVEIDIQETKDGAIVVFHDATTKRIAGKDKKVCEQTLDELRNLDAGSHKGEQWRNEKIPLFEEVLETVPSDKILVVEIKDSFKAFDSIELLLKRSGVRFEQIVFISFNMQIAERIKRLLPLTTVLWIVDLNDPFMFLRGAGLLIKKVRAAGLDGLDVSACRKVNRRFAAKAGNAGMKLYVWTVNDLLEAKRLIRAGVHGITSNCAAKLMTDIDAD